jgi:large subunit ribosomal protein L10
MPNIVNEAITAQYERELMTEVDALVVQPVGLTVQQVNAFRGRLAAAHLRMQLVRGALAQRLLESQGLTGLDPLFEGPAAMIVGNEVDGQRIDGAAIAASRVLAAWRKETGSELPALKGGIMEGEVLGAAAAGALAKLPTKRDLQARILGQILSPGRKISGQLIAGGARIAGAIKSHIAKLEGGA